MNAEPAAAPFRHDRPLQGMVAWLLLLWVVAATSPWYPRDWPLQNLLVFACAALLVFSCRRFAFSNLSHGLFTVFLSLHLIGAHYTYAELPFGAWLRELLALQRNPHDRILHLAFGLLLAVPFREILQRAAGLKASWAGFVTMTCVLGLSGFYEGLEAATAMVVSPELGAAYLGTQGDERDGTKDMMMATAGAVFALAVVAVTRWRPSG